MFSRHLDNISVEVEKKKGIFEIEVDKKFVEVDTVFGYELAWKKLEDL